ncbi:MAG: hypothetical protein AAGC77_07480 [Pseudomonadota bacterium]
MADLVEIASFFDQEEAHCARGFLLSRGIYTFFQDEHHLTVAPWLSIALGGYRLLGRPKDAEEAQRLLKAIREAEVASKPAVASVDHEIPKRRKNYFWAPIALFFAVPFIPTYEPGKERWLRLAALLLLYVLLVGLIASALPV